MQPSSNPFNALKETLEVDDKKYTMFNIAALTDERVAKLPFSIRVLLEAAIRNCDNFNVKGRFKSCRPMEGAAHRLFFAHI